MRSLLTQLENNEAVLLMYVANELPADDRAEVEEMLGRDESMRRHLAELRGAYASIDAAIGRADAGTALPSSFSAARAFGDEVRRRIRPPSQKSVDEREDASRRRMRMILYPLTAAAAIALGMALWWKSAKDEISQPFAMEGVPPDGWNVNWANGWNGPSNWNDSELHMGQVVAMWESNDNADIAEAEAQVSVLNFLNDSDALQ